MKYKQTGTNSWTIEVQENGKTKELFIEFPPEALDQVGWDLGDTYVNDILEHNPELVQATDEWRDTYGIQLHDRMQVTL